MKKTIWRRLLALLLTVGLLCCLPIQAAVSEPDFQALLTQGEETVVMGIQYVTEPIFSTMSINVFNGDYAQYQDTVTGNCGIINSAGEILWQPQDSKIAMIEPYANGMAGVMIQGKGWQPYTVKGKRLCPASLGAQTVQPATDWATMQEPYLYGQTPNDEQEFLVDKAGNFLMADKLGAVYNGKIPCLENGRWSLQTIDGKRLLPPDYTALVFLAENRLVAEQDGVFRVIDLNGETLRLLPGVTVVARCLEPGSLLVKKGDKYGLLNSEGAFAVDCRFTRIEPGYYHTSHLQSDAEAPVYYIGIAEDGQYFFNLDGSVSFLFTENLERIGTVTPMANNVFLVYDGKQFFVTRPTGEKLMERTAAHAAYALYADSVFLFADKRAERGHYDCTLYNTDMEPLVEIQNVSADSWSLSDCMTEAAWLCTVDGTTYAYSLEDGSLLYQTENAAFGGASQFNSYLLRDGKVALADAMGRPLTDFVYEYCQIDDRCPWIVQMHRNECYELFAVDGTPLSPPLQESVNFEASRYDAYQFGGKYGILKLICPGDPLFDDIAADSWYAKGVDFCAKTGLMQGVGGGKFAPDKTMTRAMLVQVLYNLSGEKTEAYGFTDVPSDAWYAAAVNWAAANGIVYGVSDTRFAPDSPVTREQMVTILNRYAQRFGEMAGSADALDAFTDADQVAEFALDGLRWAVSAGLIYGTTETTVSPQGVASRAQIATILTRFVRWMAARPA